MANKPVLLVFTEWADSSGETGIFSFWIERPEPLNLTTVANKIRAVVEKIDPLVDAKFVKAEIRVPAAAQIANPKTDPLSGSRYRRRAKCVFTGAVGENLNTERVTISVPDPLNNKITVADGKASLNASDSDVQAFINAVLAKALSSSGETLTGYSGSVIVQTVGG